MCGLNKRSAWRHLFTVAVCIYVIASCTAYGAAAEEIACLHVYSVTITRYATADTPGERLYVCDKCGYSYTDAIDIVTHDWGDWQILTEPTCAQPGKRMRVCTRNPDYPHYEYEEIPATGNHTYVSAVTEESTCLKDGVTTYACTVCANSYTEVIPAHSRHDYTISATSAGCEIDGVKIYDCTVCGDVYEEIIPAIGHKYGEWTVDIEATEEHIGHMYRVCLHDASHLQEQILPLIEHVSKGPNKLDYILSGTLVAGTAVLSAPLFTRARTLRWYEKKKKEFYNKLR